VRYLYAHNDYLQFAVETGGVGLGLMGLVVLFSLYAAVSAMRRRRNQFYSGVGFAAFMGVLSILIHSVSDFNLQIPSNAIYFTLLLALAWIASSTPTRVASG